MWQNVESADTRQGDFSRGPSATARTSYTTRQISLSALAPEHAIILSFSKMPSLSSRARAQSQTVWDTSSPRTCARPGSAAWNSKTIHSQVKCTATRNVTLRTKSIFCVLTERAHVLYTPYRLPHPRNYNISFSKCIRPDTSFALGSFPVPSLLIECRHDIWPCTGRTDR